jgi:hypothetical protein
VESGLNLREAVNRKLLFVRDLVGVVTHFGREEIELGVLISKIIRRNKQFGVFKFERGAGLGLRISQNNLYLIVSSLSELFTILDLVRLLSSLRAHGDLSVGISFLSED